MVDNHRRDDNRAWKILASILAIGLLGWGLYEAMDNDDGATGAEIDDTSDTDMTNTAGSGAADDELPTAEEDGVSGTGDRSGMTSDDGA